MTTLAEQVSHLAETMVAQHPNEIMSAFTREQAQLVAVSQQTPSRSDSTPEKNELTLTVFSDPGHQLGKASRILRVPSDEVRAAQLQLGLDLTEGNAEGTTGLPMPTTTIVDTNRATRRIDVHPDDTTRSEPEQIVGALDTLASR